MATPIFRARNRAFVVLLALTLGVIQLQLVTAGSASASSACNGAFQGSPPGTLAIHGVPTTPTIQPGQSITFTATWDPADWSGLDAYYNCWQLNGSELGSLELEEKPPANDGTVVQTVTVPNSASDGDVICVRTRLSGQPASGNTTTQKSNKLCWTVNAAPPPQPDVKITKTASDSNVAAGDSFTYTLKVENISATNATNVVITDKIPASLTIGAMPAGCTKAGQDVTCNVGNLAAGASRSYDIPVTTSNGSCPSVDNTGKVTATDDSNPNNNQDSASADVTCVTPQPDVKIEKTASEATVAAGDGFDWNLKVTNTSAVDATGVKITDTIAASLTIGSLPSDCTKTGQDVTCNVGGLAAGASKSYAIPVTTSNGSCPSVDNTGTVRADVDTHASNNSDSASVDVTCETPDVAIRKSSSAPVAGVFSGESFDYAITVENVSGGDVNDVVVHDSIPAGLTITDAGSCTVSGQNITCDLGTVAAGASKTVTITVTATDAACPEVTNTATVEGSNDGNSGNNTSQPVTDIVNCREPGITVKITKTNDGNGDGRYTDSEEAKRSGSDVPFRLVITNTGEETVLIDDLTDTFPGDVVDLLAQYCSSLDGKSLAPGESAKCLFTLNNYSPDSEAGYKTNTAEVCVEMDGDSTKTDCDNDTSKVRSAEVLGRTITPPPTQTPPSGTAFTGNEGTITFGLLATALLLFGTGVMYAGYRKRQRFDG
jgi:uncharacterized repeat protein (TIGR01451 family)/fimbrial isopeptide formation D2 family protein